MNPTAETGIQIEDRELSEDELAKNSAKLVAKLNQVLPKISGFNEALYKSFLSGGRAVTFEGGGSRFTVARIVDPKLTGEGFTGEGWFVNVHDVNPAIKGAEGVRVYNRTSPSEILDERSAQRGGQSEIDYKSGKRDGKHLNNTPGAVTKAGEAINKLAVLASPTPAAQKAA